MTDRDVESARYELGLQLSWHYNEDLDRGPGDDEEFDEEEEDEEDDEDELEDDDQ